MFPLSIEALDLPYNGMLLGIILCLAYITEFVYDVSPSNILIEALHSANPNSTLANANNLADMQTLNANKSPTFI